MQAARPGTLPGGRGYPVGSPVGSSRPSAPLCGGSAVAGAASHPATLPSSSVGPSTRPGPTYPELSAVDVEALLVDLVAAYTAQAFQQELAAVHAACAKSGAHPLLVLGPTCLKAQAPVLEKYGQPPTPQGVDLMKHSVERRVAEGHGRIEALANEARAILGLIKMPDRTASAEHVLAAKVDETNKRIGLNMASREKAEEEMASQLRRRFAGETVSGALPAQSAAYLEGLLGSREVPLPSVLSMLKMAKIGITVPGLSGKDIPVSVPVLEAPSAEEFFRTQVLPNQPAVLRGILDETTFPPLRDFPDVAFLRRRCGSRRVCVKSLAHKDGGGRPVFVSDPELKLPMSAFLEHLEAHERDSSQQQPFYLGKVPLRKELPELAEELQQATSSPQKLYGSCFGSLVPDGVFTYFGCGRNTTAVHFDAHENLLLCLCGTKRLFLYPPSDARYVYPCNDFSRSAMLPFTPFEDMSAELRDKFCLAQHARPLEVTLGAGDLLYLPTCWWHCVEGSDDRNMILNWWFEVHADKKVLAFAPRGDGDAIAA